MDTHYPISGLNDAPACGEAGGAKRPAAAHGATPRTVIRGESHSPHPQRGSVASSAAFTDYLNATFPLRESSDPLGWFEENLHEVAGYLFGRLEDRNRGAHGWTRSFCSEYGGIIYAFGGQRDTAFVSIPGDGCSLVRSWDALGVWLRDWCDARITRWDGAVDDYEGGRSVDDAVAGFHAGAFKCGGRQPRYDLRGDWLEPTGQGRTFYVGSRRSGKLFRAYEKGKQLGDPSSPWVRHEVEWHNTDRIVPWDVLWSPGTYVAGAYPYLSWVSDAASRIKTIQVASTISEDFLIGHCRRTYGPLIGTLRRQGKSSEEIVSQLSREGVPSRLVVSSLLGIAGSSS